ncbi:P-loop containing nucleoside triphosphate hydrolase protein [Abortiporus biennis]|nr:P-loop containing nucleoside triphosphate hydrolase protein [Abortiporus biennis]
MHLSRASTTRWDDSLFIPPYVAATSCTILLAQIAFNGLKKKHSSPVGIDGLSDPGPHKVDQPTTVKRNNTIAALEIFRLICCLILSGISIYLSFAPSVKRNITTDLFEVDGPRTGSLFKYLYASLLATFSALSANRSSRSTIVSAHLNIILLPSWVIFIYRDIVPLCTYTLTPLDKVDIMYWVEFVLLGFAAFLIPLCMPRVYVPLDPSAPMPHPNEEQMASLLSLMLFNHCDSTIVKAYRVPHLTLEELPPLSDREQIRNLMKRGYIHLDPLQRTKRQHLFWGLVFGVFPFEHLEMAMSLILRAGVSLISPFCLNRLLGYIENRGKEAVVKPWVWVAFLFFGPLVTSIVSQWYYHLASKVLVDGQSILTQLIFDHALRIRVKPEVSETENNNVNAATPNSKNLVGRINNLVTADLNAMSNGQSFMFLLFSIPFQIITGIWALYIILGWSAFVGLGWMLLLAPIPAYISKVLRGVYVSDARVQVVTEAMNVIRMIKLFGWEKKMSDKIDETRQDQLTFLRKIRILELFSTVVSVTIPITTMVITLGVYTLIMKRDLTASRVFPALAASVSLDRINDFLSDTELLDEFTDSSTSQNSTPRLEPEPHHPTTIGIRAASFTWTSQEHPNSGTPGSGRRNFKLVIDNEVSFKYGGLNLIVGPTGSGKTSLLMALLGEMHYIPHGPNSAICLPRSDGIAYHAQESWVLNDTIRNNILFGSPYDEGRYQLVIKQCALVHDLNVFDAGDETEVGEKGITLSGGQKVIHKINYPKISVEANTEVKARITLARAIYSSASILLLDDIFAALDVHTSKWIVDKCLMGDLVRGRTVILVTHNIALVSSIAQFVVSLGADGRIWGKGPLSDVLAVDKHLLAELAKDKLAIKAAEETEDHKELSETVAEDPIKKFLGKLIIDEEIAEGHVGWSALKLYFPNMSKGKMLGVFWLSFTFFAISSKILYALEYYALSLWAGEYDHKDPSEVSSPYYLTLYTACVFGSFALYAATFILHTFGSLHAAKVIHRILVKSIFGATMRWLDKTPVSRILTRCTEDIASIDGAIPRFLYILIDVSLQLVSKMMAIVAVAPTFLLPGVILSVAGFLLGDIYMKAQLPVKRESSNAKAPMLGHLSAAISGLVSIRAYGAQGAFRNESYRRVDRLTRTNRIFWNLNMWISIRTDALAAVFTSSLSAYLVYGLGVSAANTGFSLTMAVGFSGLLILWVKTFNLFETNGNSLERIQQYLTIEQEPQSSEIGKPPAYWPASGDLRVENLSARYSMDGPEILHNLTFHVKSGERIGVVGRTGSGKSSLTLSLLRCILTTGDIYYDGILINNLNLDALRSNITVIPQVPELLSGTVRQNLDPFSQYDDPVLNDALRASGLFSSQTADENENSITLETQISGGGGNLSIGQRQILALARAVVRQSKLLILDEATSAIDYDTDNAIQKSLREGLDKDVTVLAIAHRLQTIMDADRIMVLDSGRIVEMDKPSVLLQNKAGLLHALVNESHDKHVLYALAGSSGTASKSLG